MKICLEGIVMAEEYDQTMISATAESEEEKTDVKT